MHCKTCQAPASGACRSCGGSYCIKHGGMSHGRPICADCFEGRRLRDLTIAVELAGLGAFTLFMARHVPSGHAGWVVALLALEMFVLAAMTFRDAKRPNPWKDGPRE